MKSRRAAFAFVFLTATLDMVALGIIVPVLPKLVVTFMGGNAAHAAEIFGVFGTIFALMQFVFAPVLGMLSDRFGRRPVIVLSNFGMGLDYLIMALAPNVGWLFVGRTLSGITAASFSTAMAYVADVTPHEKRAGAFGMLSAAFGIGFILGPALGGVLGNVDPRLPFWVAAGLSVANAVYGLIVLPESLPPEKRPTALVWRRANPLGSLKLLRSHSEIFGLAAVNFFVYVAHEVLPNVYVLYVIYRFAWDERTIGVSLALVGAMSMLVSAWLVRAAVERLGERRVLFAGLLAGVAAFALFGAAGNGALFLAAIPLIALWGLAGPPAQSIMSRRVSASEQGELQGALSSMRGISMLIGPGLFTLTFATFIDKQRAVQLPGAPWFLAALLMIVSIALAWGVTRVRTDSDSAEVDAPREEANPSVAAH